jgi:hypothetical protein
MAKTVPNLPANVYLNPINFGMTEGSNGSSQLEVATMSVAVNNTHQFNPGINKGLGQARLQVRLRMAVDELHSARYLQSASESQFRRHQRTAR